MIDNGAGMTRRGFCRAGLAGALGLAAGRSWGAGMIPPKVKIGLISSLFRDVYQPLVMFAMAPFKSFLEAQMKVKSELTNGGHAVELGRKLKDEELHLGVFHGIEFAWARQRYPNLKPLFIAVNVEPTLRAHLIVRKADGLAGVADLPKRSPMRTAARGREHCYLFLERSCVRPGTNPWEYYKITRAGETSENLSSLAAGRTDSVLADGIDWEQFKEASPAKAAKLTPLASSQPFPCALVGHYGDVLDDDMLTKFRIGMRGAHKTEKGKEMLSVMRITHFAKVPDDFDDQLAAAAKAYPAPLVK